MRWATTLILLLALAGLHPSSLVAQERRHKVCATDSMTARTLGASLEHAYRDTPPAAPDARAVWIRDQDTCARAGTALAQDSVGIDGHDSLFVFSLEATGGDRYAVVWRNGSVGEWQFSACFFDGRWRRRGICLAM